MKVKAVSAAEVRSVRCIIDRSEWFPARFEYERIRQDPKDGELCLNRVKPEETQVEARRDSDVQIDLQIWVQGRKTNRTIQQLVPSEVSLRIAGTIMQFYQVKRMIRRFGD